MINNRHPCQSLYKHYYVSTISYITTDTEYLLHHPPLFFSKRHLFIQRGDTLIFHIFKYFSSSRLSPGGRKALYILPPVVPFTYGRMKDAGAKIYIFLINKEKWKKKIQFPFPLFPFTVQYWPFISQKMPFTKKNLKYGRFWVGL